jgi:hypothetical protein
MIDNDEVVDDWAGLGLLVVVVGSCGGLGGAVVAVVDDWTGLGLLVVVGGAVVASPLTLGGWEAEIGSAI